MDNLVTDVIENFIDNNISNLGLGFKDTIKIITTNEYKDNDNTVIGWVHIDSINHNKDYFEIKEMKKNNDDQLCFSMKFTNEIFISKSALNDVTKKRVGIMGIQNNEVIRMIKTVFLEEALLHESRHLYQFNNFLLNINDIEIIEDSVRNKWGLVPSDQTQYMFEKDAIIFSYQMYRKICSLVSDRKFGLLFNEADYYNSRCFSLNDNFTSSHKELIKKVLRIKKYLVEGGLLSV